MNQAAYIFLLLFLVLLLVGSWIYAEVRGKPGLRRLSGGAALMIMCVATTLSYGVGYFLGQSRATPEVTGVSQAFYRDASAAISDGRVTEAQNALAQLGAATEEYRPWVYMEQVRRSAVTLRVHD